MAMPRFNKTEKKCLGCEKVLGVSHFGKARKNSHLFKSRCRPCQAEYRKLHPLPKEQKKKHAVKFSYGLSWVEYQAMLKKQGGRCVICQSEFDLSSDHGRNGKNKPCVDHCHSSDKVRGILCGQCNRGLGFFRDNKDHLQSAINYLRASQ